MIFENITAPLIAEEITSTMQIAGASIAIGLVLYSILSIFGYGIIQTLRLFNIKNY